MTLRNLQLLVLISVISLACYKKADSAYRSRYGRMFDTFVEVLQQIDRNYVEQVDEGKLFESGLESMVDQLDPYSAYMPPQESEEFQEGLNQQFGGIGIEVFLDRETKTLTVTNPMLGTPAHQAGVLAGDRILFIDGQSTAGWSIEDAVHRLRGKAGQNVRLTVLHPGQEQPSELEITRGTIHVDSVLGDRRDPSGEWNFLLSGSPRIGYLRVTTFGEETVEELKRALANLDEQRAEGLVLDLRDNSGGLLSAAIETCDLFIPEGRIVSTRGRDKTVDLETHNATGAARYTKWPMVVLVNHFSASASEIVAACLQDQERARVVGQRTWGKGTVQNMIPLDGGKSMLRLTVASYWRPSLKNIHRLKESPEEGDWGVRPDPEFDVPLSDDQLRAMLENRRLRDTTPPANPPAEVVPPPEQETVDLQLRRGLEYLRARAQAQAPQAA